MLIFKNILLFIKPFKIDKQNNYNFKVPSYIKFQQTITQTHKLTNLQINIKLPPKQQAYPSFFIHPPSHTPTLPMSHLSHAGQSTITNPNEINRAFTKGLYGVDPSELERKQMQRRAYQEELRSQAEEQQRRKAAEKARDREEDERLQRKIQMDIQREKEEKDKVARAEKEKHTIFGGSNSPGNNTTTNNPPSNSNMSNSRTQPPLQQTNNKQSYFNTSSQNTMVKNTLSSPEISLYRNSNLPLESYQSSFPTNLQQNNNQAPYGYVPRSYYNMQQEKYYQQQLENRVRRYKQTLDRKLEEVYKQIESSKKNQNNDSIIDDLRRRLRSNSYLGHDHYGNDMQKSSVKQFQDQFSQFYKIPKRSNDYSESTKTRTTSKNLDYDSQSRYKSSFKTNYVPSYGSQSRNIAQQDNSRMYTQRPDKSEYNDLKGKWGNKRNNNFLGNRQALDYKIESTLSNIDNIIDTHNSRQIGGGNY